MTEPFDCEGPVPFDAGCDGEWPLMELDNATFFGVEPLEILANPFDVICVPLSSGRMLLSAKRLRFAGRLRSGPLTVEPVLSVLSTASVPIPSSSAINKSAPKPSDVSWDMGDERCRLRREPRVPGSWSTGALCAAIVVLGVNTVARIEDVGFGKEGSVSEEACRRVGMAGSSVVDGAVVFGMFSSARSTSGSAAGPGGVRTSAKVQKLSVFLARVKPESGELECQIVVEEDTRRYRGKRMIG